MVTGTDVNRSHCSLWDINDDDDDALLAALSSERGKGVESIGCRSGHKEPLSFSCALTDTHISLALTNGKGVCSQLSES